MDTFCSYYKNNYFEQLQHFLKQFDNRNVAVTLFTNMKDKISLENQTDVSFKVKSECKEIYIGHTEQNLHKRIKKHKRDARPSVPDRDNKRRPYHNISVTKAML